KQSWEEDGRLGDDGEDEDGEDGRE
ncbi:hypothetical protein Tco_0888457, partial [Tanacetum coccineum]